MDTEGEVVIGTDILYHGKERSVFEKIVTHRFGGDSSVKSQTAIVLYMAMFDTMQVLEKTIVDGQSAMRAADAISENIANIIVSMVINMFPGEVREDVMKYILMDMVTTIPTFYENCLRVAKEEHEKQDSGLKN